MFFENVWEPRSLLSISNYFAFKTPFLTFFLTTITEEAHFAV